MRAIANARIAGLCSAVVLAAVLAGGAASAGQRMDGPAWMPVGGPTSQPIGHYDFCKRYPAQCAIKSHAAPLHFTTAFWQHIVKVNNDINHSVKPMTDEQIYGKDEYWTYPDKGLGDCEDYALDKQRKLMQEGIPAADLLLTVVRKSDGEGHAVLTLRTDGGDFILDNMTDKVLDWADTGYSYLKRQSDTDSGRWVSIEAPRNILVGSVSP